MTASAKDIFEALKGEWSLDRVYSDESTVKGKMVFTPEGDDRYLCEENGINRLGTGVELEAARKYIYELRAGILTIIYNDPYRMDDVMHELKFDDKGVARHSHPCSSDLYDLTFIFNSDKRIEMHYVVTGDKKDYSFVSVLTRP